MDSVPIQAQDKLLNKIWITRKNRINTESRLLKYQFLFSILIPWYSIALIFYSIMPSRNSWITPVFTVCGSIVVLVSSIITSSQKLELRAHLMKEHYIELSQLLSKLENHNNPKHFHYQVAPNWLLVSNS